MNKPLFFLAGKTNIGATPNTTADQCFVGPCYYPDWRCGDVGRLLKTNQSSAEACVITTLGFTPEWRRWTDAARALPSVEQTSDIALLGRSLIECNYTVPLLQAEELVQACNRGEPTGMSLKEDNFLFVESGDEECPVSVMGLYREDWHLFSFWYPYLSRLADGGIWNGSYCLMIRNLDASKLGL